MIQVAVQPAAERQRQLAGLFAHDEDERISLFREPEGRAVPSAERTVRDGGLGEGKDRSRRGESLPSDDHRPVVERRRRKEDALQQLGGDDPFDGGARRGQLFQRRVPLHRNDGPYRCARKSHQRHRDLLGHRRARSTDEHPEGARTAEPRERLTELRLEHHGDREDAVGEECRKEIRHHRELEERRREPPREEHQEAEDDLQGAGAGQEAKDFKVVVTLDDPPPELRPGLSCTATIQTATREQILTAPIQALTIREQDTPGSKKKVEKEGVFVLTNGVALFRPVKTGITGITEIEILDGLTENDQIVTGPYQVLRTLQDNTRIKIQKAP